MKSIIHMRNSHGIEVKECCASCRFKDLTRLMTSRFCIEHQKRVKPREWCYEWALSDQLEAAGSAGGKVKRKAYLKFLLEVRANESLADQMGIRTLHKTIDQIRSEFEKNHGSIFLSL